MRKVTELLPTEAILISSDADLKVLEEFEKEGVLWVSRNKPTQFNPALRWCNYPYYVFYEDGNILWSEKNYSGKYIVYPASDFIPTEPERGLTIVKGDGSIITAQNQDGRVFDVERIPTEAEKVEVFDSPSNDSIIATFLRAQIDWYESNHDYQIATETIRCWLDELEGKTEKTDLTRNTPNQ